LSQKKKIKYSNLIELSKIYYEEKFETYGDSPQGVNWRDAKTQELRFKELLGLGRLEGNTIHEVGCGLAHLYDYINKIGINTNYIGTDISNTMIAGARQRLGVGVSLYSTNILDLNREEVIADYVVSSGLFSVKGEARDVEWWSFVSAMIKRMFELCNKGIGFNLMTSYVDYKEPHLFYKSPAEVFDFCMEELGKRVVLKHDYPLWEYTVYVYK